MTRRRSLAADRRGGIAILAAVGMTALIAMAAFAIDLGAAYAQRARLQKVADSAALAGEISWVKSGGSATAAQATVQDVVVANGWATSIIKTTTAPTSAVPNVTVSLAAPSTLTLARVVASYTTVTTTGYSVASLVTATTAACLVSLTGMQVNGPINVGSCAVAANSSANNAINVNSSGSITAGSIDTPGGIVANGTVSGKKMPGAAPATDPYSGTQSAEASQVSACKSNYINYTGQTSGGCYQGTLSSAVSLKAGTYVFGSLNINPGGSISGTGVTLIFTQQFSPGNGTISISAPTSGSFAGVAIYGSSAGINMNTGVTYAVNGAIYDPAGPIVLDGGSTNASSCTYIVANSITSNSSSTFTIPQANCGSYTAPSVSGGSKIGLIQ